MSAHDDKRLDYRQHLPDYAPAGRGHFLALMADAYDRLAAVDPEWTNRDFWVELETETTVLGTLQEPAIRTSRLRVLTVRADPRGGDDERDSG